MHLLDYDTAFSSPQKFTLPRPKGDGIVEWQKKKDALISEFSKGQNPMNPKLL